MCLKRVCLPVLQGLTSAVTGSPSTISESEANVLCIMHYVLYTRDNRQLPMDNRPWIL